MNIENISESMPHLKDVFELFRKVKEFNAIELKYNYGGVEENYHHYIKEDIDTVIQRFSEIFSLPREQLNSLQEGMQSGLLDFMLIPQNEVAAFATPVMAEEMVSLLYLISRPFFRSLRASLNVDNIYWEEGKCPVCNASPALSLLESEERRKYTCSFCETTGYYKRIGCTYCNNEDAGKIDIFYVESKDDIRADACTKCKSYVKTINTEKVAIHDLEELDLISLHIDIVAQNKGYFRRSPNPVGITRIV